MDKKKILDLDSDDDDFESTILNINGNENDYSDNDVASIANTDDDYEMDNTLIKMLSEQFSSILNTEQNFKVVLEQRDNFIKAAKQIDEISIKK